MRELPAGIASRWAHFKPIVLRPGMAILIGVYSFLALITWVRDELVKHSPGEAVKHVSDLLPPWSPWVWTLLGLASLIVLILEGSYRLAQETETQHGAELTKLRTDAARTQEELRAVRAARPRPDLVLVYEGVAQFAALKLVNNGEADATRVSISASTVGMREIRFSDFDRIRRGATEEIDFQRFNLFPEVVLPRKDPEWSAGGRWRHALVWLCGDSGESACVTVTFYGDEGRTQYDNHFEIGMDTESHVKVFPTLGSQSG